jgi:hypothetical protein
VKKWEVEYYQFGTDELKDALAAGWEPYSIAHLWSPEHGEVVWIHVRRAVEE